MKVTLNAALSECYRLLEENGGNVEACVERFPALAGEIREHFRVRDRFLKEVQAGEPGPRGRVALMSALQDPQAAQRRPGAFPLLRLAGALAGVAVFAALTVGAGAVGGGIGNTVNDVLGAVGLGSLSDGSSSSDTPKNHGTAVSNAVHEAQASATPGPGFGKAVSAAACKAAHDRSTLPQGAQDASSNGKGGDNCDKTHDEEADSEDAESSDSADEPKNHGTAVSKAVHDAQASTTPGPGRGKAVSEAACKAAHDRSTLPQGAQDASPNGKGGDKCDKSAGTESTSGTPVPSSGSSQPPGQEKKDGGGPGNQPGQGQGRGGGNR